jgi:hypothetical protein
MKSPSLKERFARFAKRQRLKRWGGGNIFNSAAVRGDVETMREILDLCPEAVHWREKVPAGYYDDYTPLMKALRAKHNIPALQLLLDHGADVNARLSNGWTVLHGAVDSCDREAIALLIRYGANPDAKKDDGSTPRIIAQNNAGRVPWSPVFGDAPPTPDMTPVIEAALARRQTGWTEGTDRKVRLLPQLKFRTR